MEEIQCCHCGDFFLKSPRHKQQSYCIKPACRRARKAAWKRKKMREDPECRLNQKASNKQWAKANPGYWKRYRKRNPDKAERNRILQTLRNRRRSRQGSMDPREDPSLIAKVDTSIPKRIKVFGEFYMVPVIAKVDALKVYIYEIPTPYQ
jgi:hypothetical protein